jgi:hypothetical protein
MSINQSTVFMGPKNVLQREFVFLSIWPHIEMATL